MKMVCLHYTVADNYNSNIIIDAIARALPCKVQILNVEDNQLEIAIDVEENLVKVVEEMLCSITF